MLGVVKASATKGFEVAKDLPEPSPGAGDVLIEVAAASLCGTDREVYEWTPSAQAFGLDLPVVTGHEGSGTVLEVGKEVAGLRVGDRVALESHLICGT
jgi:threonine 3-dehydrogenase